MTRRLLITELENRTSNILSSTTQSSLDNSANLFSMSAHLLYWGEEVEDVRELLVGRDAEGTHQLTDSLLWRGPGREEGEKRNGGSHHAL